MLSILVGQLLQVEYPFFIAMTAIISMDKTMGNSFKMGRNRVLGTLIGASLGVLLAYIDQGNAFLCGLGILLLIPICNKLHLQGSITIGGIVMLAIMIHTDKSPLFYGFHRTLDTFIGATLSFIVNISIFPYANVKRLDEMTIALWDETDKLVQALSTHEMIDSNKIRNELKEISMELTLYQNEVLLHPKKIWVDKLQKHYDMALRLLLELEVLETINRTTHQDVFDYHINSALTIYNEYIDEIQSRHKRRL